jgi:hypothetical protein
VQPACRSVLKETERTLKPSGLENRGSGWGSLGKIYGVPECEVVSSSSTSRNGLLNGLDVN